MIALTAAVLADADDWNGHMGWDGGWWMLILGTLIMVGLVVLIVWLVRTTAGGVGTNSSAAPEDPMGSARRILAERYARGEISTDEYRERVDGLAGHG